MITYRNALNYNFKVLEALSAGIHRQKDDECGGASQRSRKRFVILSNP